MSAGEQAIDVFADELWEQHAAAAGDEIGPAPMAEGVTIDDGLAIVESDVTSWVERGRQARRNARDRRHAERVVEEGQIDFKGRYPGKCAVTMADLDEAGLVA